MRFLPPLIVGEAGGEVTDFDGNPHRLDRRDILASNGALHSFALRVAQGKITGRPSVAKRLGEVRKRMAKGMAGKGR